MCEKDKLDQGPRVLGAPASNFQDPSGNRNDENGNEKPQEDLARRLSFGSCYLKNGQLRCCLHVSAVSTISGLIFYASPSRFGFLAIAFFVGALFLYGRVSPSVPPQHNSKDETSASENGKSEETNQNPATPRPRKNVKEIFSHEELAKHTTEADCWVAIHGSVYNVSGWAARHPGGVEILLSYAGQDASDQFELFHPPEVAKKLRPFLRGRLEARRPPAALVQWGLGPQERGKEAVRRAGAPPPGVAVGTEEDPVTLEYRVLRRALWEEGAFVPRPSFYLGKQLLVFALLVAALAALGVWPGTAATAALGLWPAPTGAGEWVGWGRLCWGAALLALALQQAAFLSHDALHNGVFARRGRTRARAALAQLNGGLLLGVSAGMWLEEHSLHHAHTLRPHADPQFKYFPLWLQSDKEVPHWLAELPAAPGARRALWAAVAALVRVQHLTVLPLAMGIGRYNFLAIAWAWAAQRRRWSDLAAMAAHLAWYGALVGRALPGWQARAAFVALNYALVGVLHVQLLMSHLCTQQFSPAEEAALGAVRHQLATTRNYRCGPAEAWFHGGLERQVEHHLFPQLPRHALAGAAPRVRELCARHGIPYLEESFPAAVALCLGKLREVAAEVALGNPLA